MTTSLNTILTKLPFTKDGVLFVHSAFKGFARDGYQAQEMLETLVQQNQGTLLLPTMSWRFVKPHTPFFDVATTPSNTGILTELFRHKYAETRSLHPTHSVAGLGKHAQKILGTHQHCVTPCGTQSPFAKLVEYDAYILMLGVGMDCCTLVHHVEEMLAPDLYVKPENETEIYECKNWNGEVSSVKLRRHRFLPRNYWQFQDLLAENGHLQIFRVDNSICLGFSAKKLYECVANVLKCRPDAIIAHAGQRYRMM